MIKKIKVKNLILEIKITKDGDYFLAVCNNWPDCYAIAKTVNESISELKKVIVETTKIYKAEKIQIPAPTLIPHVRK